MKRILVTGATGFIGRHLVRQLIRMGHEPRVLVRSPDKALHLFRTRLDCIPGDLQDRAATNKAMHGVDTVLHLAALATAHCPDPHGYMRDNSWAVEMLLDEAAKAGVRRFVHVSTIAALPPERPAPQRGIRRRPTPYALSKIASEKVVGQYAAAGNHAVVVRPTRVYGPGPWNDANGTTRLMAMYLRGHFRFRVADHNVQANYVYVKDVVQGILQAATRGRSGESYQLGGTNATLPDFLRAISEVSGISRRVLKVPAQVVAPVAHLAEGLGRLGGCPALTPEWLNNFLEHRPVDISRTRQDLGYNPLDLHDGIAETIPWLLLPNGGDSHAHQIHVRRREAWA